MECSTRVGSQIKTRQNTRAYFTASSATKTKTFWLYRRQIVKKKKKISLLTSEKSFELNWNSDNNPGVDATKPFFLSPVILIKWVSVLPFQPVLIFASREEPTWVLNREYFEKAERGHYADTYFLVSYSQHFIYGCIINGPSKLVLNYTRRKACQGQKL